MEKLDSVNSIPIKEGIDVVIPAFNAARYITEALDSVALQGSLVGRIIVVNDGSTDDTELRIQEFIHKHPDLDVRLITQKNAGLSAARNTGIRSSTASWIALLDADDCWKAGKLSAQAQLINLSTDSKIAVVYSDYEVMSASGESIKKPNNILHPYLRGHIYLPLLRGNFVSGSGSSVLIKRKALDCVGLFDESLPACEDWDLWLRIAKSFHFDFVAAPLVRIRLHPENMQKNRLRMIDAELRVLNKFAQDNGSNLFLYWKIRTYLQAQHIDVSELPSYRDCSPNLQKYFNGWRLWLGQLILIPVLQFGRIYLKIVSPRN